MPRIFGGRRSSVASPRYRSSAGSIINDTGEGGRPWRRDREDEPPRTRSKSGSFGPLCQRDKGDPL